MNTAATNRFAPILLFVTLILLPFSSRAQFDLGKAKKQAEKQAEKVVKSIVEEEEQKTDTAPSRNEPASSTSQRSGTESAAAGGNAREIISQARMTVSELQSILSVPSGLYSSKKEAQRFYELCKKVDYPARRAEVERAIAADPSAREMESYSVDEVLTAFPEHFNGLINQYLVKEINNAIELAYAEKAKGARNVGAALDHAEAAQLVAEAILITTPGNPQIESLREDARAAVSQMQDAFGSAVYTSDFHKAHAGKIVFSRSPVTIGSETAGAMAEAFTPADNIYMMMYFQGTFSEVTNQNHTAVTYMLVDGNDKVNYNFKLDGDARGKSYLAGEVSPDPSNSTTRGALIFTTALKDLSPRKHSITIRTNDDYGKVIAEGTFSLDCSGGLAPIASKVTALENRKLGAVDMPAAAKKDAALEKSMLSAVSSWNETPLKAVITDNDWTTERHPVSGAITGRIINAVVAFKKTDGNCRIFEISFRQPYNGKSYGKTEQYGVGDSKDIQCSKVK